MICIETSEHWRWQCPREGVGGLTAVVAEGAGHSQPSQRYYADCAAHRTAARSRALRPGAGASKDEGCCGGGGGLRVSVLLLLCLQLVASTVGAAARVWLMGSSSSSSSCCCSSSSSCRSSSNRGS